MLKQRLTLEFLKDEKVFRLEFEEGRTWGDLYDILTQMKNFVVKRITEENEASQQKTEEKNSEQE